MTTVADIQQQWLMPILAFAAWPAAVVVVVLAALVLTSRDQRPAILAGIAEVIRAARGKETPPQTPVNPGARASAIGDGPISPTG